MYQILRNLFDSGSAMKAYKVQDASRENRFGITAKNLADLTQKGKQKLKIPANEKVTIVCEDDGTEVDSDDYFNTLESQSCFVFLRAGENWNGVGELVYFALNKLFNNTKKQEIAVEIRELLGDEKSPEKISIISQYLDILATDVDAEERFEDEDWFEGLDKKYKTKGEVMKNAAQQRIRSYLTSAKDQIKKENDPAVKSALSAIMEEMNVKLKKNGYHGHYFDRSASAKQRFCDNKGWFKCEGAFDEAECLKLHRINPYASKGYRQLFGLWNLDHITEKSREVIPSLIEAAKKKPKGSKLNSDEVYKYLFTRSNLRLVQVGCHKKAARTKTISPESFYVEL
ncbi:DNA fragmentation factor subunit beta-like isoform X2 [Physella acuta]|uniref:DNA fragmentation factor subunit beta-like isoform X2 n=1 Tax=Physella acuta TaxID=109671 RepID=UPI0027DD7EA2|nr:DNA fragmentation factor subunit beta-like isoform X2 [Physella acuta]